jgi:hypothetical protein
VPSDDPRPAGDAPGIGAPPARTVFRRQAPPVEAPRGAAPSSPRPSIGEDSPSLGEAGGDTASIDAGNARADRVTPPLGPLPVIPIARRRAETPTAPTVTRIYRRPPRPSAASPGAAAPETFEAAALERAIDEGRAPAALMAPSNGAIPAQPPATSADGYAIARAVGGPVAFHDVQRAIGVEDVTSQVEPEGGESEGSVDLEELAREVFARLRRRLLTERERHGLGYRWR